MHEAVTAAAAVARPVGRRLWLGRKKYERLRENYTEIGCCMRPQRIRKEGRREPKVEKEEVILHRGAGYYSIELSLANKVTGSEAMIWIYWY